MERNLILLLQHWNNTMNVVLLIFGAIIIFSIGVVLGFILCSILRRRSGYAGVLKVIKEGNGVLYSLELQDDPESLELEDEIVFKVETSDPSSNRK